MFIPYLLVFAIITNVNALTGQTAASFCHCDLTANFCDVDCCCDLSCITTITTQCYNSKSKSYCPQSTFFARIGTSYINSAGCFYYNSTNKIVEEVTLTTAQITKIAKNQNNFTRVSSTTPAIRSGYQIGDIMSLSGQIIFSFVDSNGQCIASGSGTTFQLKFGMNINIGCTSSDTANVPLIFSSFSGKKLYQFSSDTTTTLTIPSFNDPTLTAVTLLIVVGKYGSNDSKYIERVVLSSTSTASSSTRTLTIKFIQPSQLSQTSFSPTFFPQIPSDMFYPIYLIS